jgi:hypothetical protein
MRRNPRSRVAAKFSGDPVRIHVFDASAIGSIVGARQDPIR